MIEREFKILCAKDSEPYEFLAEATPIFINDIVEKISAACNIEPDTINIKNFTCDYKSWNRRVEYSYFFDILTNDYCGSCYSGYAEFSSIPNLIKNLSGYIDELNNSVAQDFLLDTLYQKTLNAKLSDVNKQSKHLHTFDYKAVYNYTCLCCHGRRKVTCSSCYGSGETKCYRCYGTGSEDGYNCPKCNGRGKVRECSSCGGDGYIKCRHCGGNGTMHKVGHVEVGYKASVTENLSDEIQNHYKFTASDYVEHYKLISRTKSVPFLRSVIHKYEVGVYVFDLTIETSKGDWLTLTAHGLGPTFALTQMDELYQLFTKDNLHDIEKSINAVKFNDDLFIDKSAEIYQTIVKTPYFNSLLTAKEFGKKSNNSTKIINVLERKLLYNYIYKHISSIIAICLALFALILFCSTIDASSEYIMENGSYAFLGGMVASIIITTLCYINISKFFKRLKITIGINDLISIFFFISFCLCTILMFVIKNIYTFIF